MIFGQSLNAVSHSNTCGIYATLVNPASAAGGIDKLNVNLAGFGVTAHNNVLRSDLRFSMMELASFKAPRRDQSEFRSPYVTSPRRRIWRPNLFVNPDAVQFAARFSISKKWSVFSFIRERTFGNLSNLDYNAISFLSQNDEPYPDKDLTLKLDGSFLSYQEIGFGSAFEIYDKREHYWKIGGKYKKLNGRAIYALNMPQFKSSILENGFRIQSKVNIIETSLKFLTQDPKEVILRPDIGRGNAFDIGIVYEHRPRSKKSTFRKNNPRLKSSQFNARDLLKYDYRVSLSVLDIGGLSFNSSAVTQTTYTLDVGQTVEDYLESEYTSIFELLEDSINKQQERQYFRVSLPATLNLMYDQSLEKGYFISLQYVQRLSRKNQMSTYIPSHVLVQLRKEAKRCTFGLPILLMPATRTYILGANLKAGPFFIGTNNISTILFRKFYNPSFYAGIQFSLRYKQDPTIENYRSFRTKRKKVYPWSPM
jgi:hypothetical protein